MTEAAVDVVPAHGTETSHLHHLRFHTDLTRLSGAFGGDAFGKRAESFARFFGTPTFLIAQTLVVVAWISLNGAGVISWDIYPFILLNLGFSLQAAYAAPLILLAQTRQADRDKALADADARHREALAQASLERQSIAEKQGDQLHTLLEANTALTQQNQDLTQRIEALTQEIHGNICRQP
jgi:uncharacterized membrane protein